MKKIFLTTIAAGAAIALAPETLLIGTIGGIGLIGGSLIGSIICKDDINDED